MSGVITNNLYMLYEDRNSLSKLAQDINRAIVSLQEEVWAVDAYRQRAEASSDPELKEILLHHAKEEKEHAAMLIEWLRRVDPEFDHEVKDNIMKQWKIVTPH